MEYQYSFERLECRIRAGYEKNQKTKIKLSFDELYNLFSKGDSIGKIAQRAGVSRQRIQQLWDWHFCRLFPDYKDGKDRRKKAIARDLYQKEREDPTIPLLKRVATRARNFGCSALQALDKHGNVYRKRLVIGDRLCIVSSLSNFRVEKSNRSYSRGNLRITVLGRYNFLIIERQEMSKEYEYFIIPTHILLDSCSKGRKRGPLYIYVPLERFLYTQKDRPKIDFWLYHEAWHLLR